MGAAIKASARGRGKVKVVGRVHVKPGCCWRGSIDEHGSGFPSRLRAGLPVVAGLVVHGDVAELGAGNPKFGGLACPRGALLLAADVWLQYVQGRTSCTR